MNSIRYLLFVSIYLRRCRDKSQTLILFVYLVWMVDLLGLVLACAGSEHRTQSNKAITELSQLIWRKGGFRFWHRRTDNGRYIFCSQDNLIALSRRRQEDFATHHRWSAFHAADATASFLDHTLTITLRHTHLEPYDNHEPSSTVLGVYTNLRQLCSAR